MSRDFLPNPAAEFIAKKEGSIKETMDKLHKEAGVKKFSLHPTRHHVAMNSYFQSALYRFYESGRKTGKKVNLRELKLTFFFKMAERPGFEPGVEVSPHTRLAGERLQPARPSLLKNFRKIF